MSATPVDIRATLEFAGADVHAVEGSIGWKLAQVDAAVAELIEAAGLGAVWINGKWYVVNDACIAFSNVGHAIRKGAMDEAAEARRAAIARCKGGAA